MDGKHAFEIGWLCSEPLKSRHSPDEIYTRLFAPGTVLAGALSLEDIKEIRKNEAQQACHGMLFRKKDQTPLMLYNKEFAPHPENLNSPWAGALTLQEVEEVFGWTHPH